MSEKKKIKVEITENEFELLKEIVDENAEYAKSLYHFFRDQIFYTTTPIEKEEKTKLFLIDQLYQKISKLERRDIKPIN